MMHRRAAGRFPGRVGWSVVAALVLAAPLSGQEERTIRGEVLLYDQPLTTGMLTLHRVSAGEGGQPVDSVDVAADGTFSFVLPESVLDLFNEDVYLVSIRYAGILYFSSPIGTPEDRDRTISMRVFDTEVADPNENPIVVRHRSTAWFDTEDGAIQVTDIFEISHFGDRTLVPADEGGYVWSHPVPAEAQNVSVEGVDLSDGVSIEEGMVRVSSPIPPAAGADSTRALVVRYTVPSTEVSIPFTGHTESFQLIVDQDLPRLESALLPFGGSVAFDATQNVDVYLASNLENVVVEIAEFVPPFEVPGSWLVAALALLLVGVGVYVVQRGAGRDPIWSGAPARDVLLLRTALLDEAYEKESSPDGAARVDYQTRRADLLRRLSDLTGG